MNLKTFMAYLTRSFRTKGCPQLAATARKVYHHAVIFEHDHAGSLAGIMVQLDKLPRGKNAEWYRRNALAIFRDAELAIKEAGRDKDSLSGSGRREFHARSPGPRTLKDLLPMALAGIAKS